MRHPAAAHEWCALAQNTFHGNMARTGVYAGPGPGQLRGVLWSFRTAGPIVGSPAVAGGVVVHHEPRRTPVDAATGRKIWDYPTSKSWVNATPAVANGMVYAGTSDSSRFMALDAKTGRLRFNVDVKAYMFSSPAVAGNLVYAGSHNGVLHAIDARTGAIVWQFRTEASRADPLKVLHPDGALNREAFKPVSGDFGDMYIDFYRFVSVGGIVSSPVVDAGVVYMGSMDGNLYAIH